MVDNGVFKQTLTKKQRYCPKGVPAEEIIWHMKNKEVWDVDEFQGSIIRKSYHIMDIKQPDYVMLMMKTYGTLEHLGGSDTQRRYKVAGGGLLTKQFNYCEVFDNHFNCRHQVDNNNN